MDMRMNEGEYKYKKINMRRREGEKEWGGCDHEGNIKEVYMNENMNIRMDMRESENKYKYGNVNVNRYKRDGEWNRVVKSMWMWEGI